MSEVRIRLQAPARLGAEENPARPGDEQTAAGLGDGHAPDEAGPRILYCHCAYAKVVPEEVKRDVLARLTAAGVAFDAVADLCEMSARRDPALGRIASTPDMKIAACFPRAVKWLFHAAGVSLDADRTEVLNMRERSAEEVVASLLGDDGNADDRRGVADNGKSAGAAEVADAAEVAADGEVAGDREVAGDGQAQDGGTVGDGADGRENGS